MGKGRPCRGNYVKRLINLDIGLDRQLAARRDIGHGSKSSQIEKALREILG